MRAKQVCDLHEGLKKMYGNGSQETSPNLAQASACARELYCMYIFYKSWSKRMLEPV